MLPTPCHPHLTPSQNGVGAFILQCKRLDFHYCDWHGSSRGMKYDTGATDLFKNDADPLSRSQFLQTHLSAFAKQNPGIEVAVSPRPGHHPVIRGHYMNGREKAICVRNMRPHEILEKTTLLRNASGEKLKKSNRAGRDMVKSVNESVRGIWDPYHGKQFKL